MTRLLLARSGISCCTPIPLTSMMSSSGTCYVTNRHCGRFISHRFYSIMMTSTTRSILTPQTLLPQTATRLGCIKKKNMNTIPKRVSSSSLSMSSVSIEQQQQHLVTTIIKDGYPMMLQKSNPYGNVGKWLIATSGLVIMMIHIGGITRLTKSGLSMTDWTLTGSLPPITQEEWIQEFEKYQQYPEYQQRKSMTLSEFQYIYFWEYIHRMMGRFVGIAFVGPWMYYTIRKQIPMGYQYRMILLGSMGLTQGLVGWWMVQSGLSSDRFHDKNEIRVKPIRLATHLSMAVVTYSTLLWTAFDIFQLPNQTKINTVVSSLSSSSSSSHMKDVLLRTLQWKYKCIGFVGLSGLTMISGALVAGNDAGRAYNTFPKMNDEWIPSNLYNELQPYYRNWYENTATVQFHHRILGISTACTGLYLSLRGYSVTPASSLPALLLTPQVRKGLLAVGLTSLGQALLGITALLTYVPISLAATHQMGSIIVLTSGIYVVHSMKYITKRMILSKYMTRKTIG